MLFFWKVVILKIGILGYLEAFLMGIHKINSCLKSKNTPKRSILFFYKKPLH